MRMIKVIQMKGVHIFAQFCQNKMQNFDQAEFACKEIYFSRLIILQKFLNILKYSFVDQTKPLILFKFGCQTSNFL